MKEIQQFEKEFQKKYFPKWNKISYDDKLLFLSIALAGEVGEFANIVKKRFRKKIHNLKVDRISEKEYKNKLKDELVDVFAYTILLSNLLNIDLKREYFKKMEKNKKKYGSSK